MKKYLYSLICVFTHALTVAILVNFCVRVLDYNIIADIKTITRIIMVICSLEWILMGFIFALKVKFKICHVIILILLDSIFLSLINQLNFKILEIRLELIDTLSFKGLFLNSILSGDSLGSFGIYLYISYYIMLFILGILVKKLMNKVRNRNNIFV